MPAGGASRVASRQSAALCTALHSLTSCTHSLLASQHSSPDSCHGSMLTYNWGSVANTAGGCAQWSLTLPTPAALRAVSSTQAPSK